MRRQIPVFFALAFSASAAFSQSVKITDYSTPISKAEQFWFNFDFNRSSFDGSSTTDGFAALNYNRFYDSLPFSWAIRADVEAQYLDDDLRHNRNIFATFRKYFSNSNKSFAFGSAFNNSDVINGREFQAEVHNTFFTVGLGFGRVINATALAKAIRIDEFLNKDQKLNGALSASHLNELAHLIERRNQYETTYGETYEVQWFQDMEAVLQNAGRLPDSELDAWGILRMREVLTFERIFQRMHGWTLEVGLSGQFDHENDTESVGLDARLRIDLPIGLKSQFSHFSSYREPLDDDFSNRRFFTSSSFTREITNRVDLALNHSFNYNRNDFTNFFRNDFFTTKSTRLSAEFFYYLENRFTLTISGNVFGQNLTRLDERDDWRWGTTFIAALGYRIR